MNNCPIRIMHSGHTECNELLGWNTHQDRRPAAGSAREAVRNDDYEQQNQEQNANSRGKTPSRAPKELVHNRRYRLQCPEAALKQHHLDHKSPIIIMKVVMSTTKDR